MFLTGHEQSNFAKRFFLEKTFPTLFVQIAFLPPCVSPLTKGGIKEGLFLLHTSLKSFDYHQANSDNQSPILDKFDLGSLFKRDALRKYGAKFLMLKIFNYIHESKNSKKQ
jgi:hypothetical protein